MNRDLVTIVIPVYNAEQFIIENVESVLGQTYRNLEIIYVCDGCTDHTVEILQEYAKKDFRIFVHIENDNSGAALARNMGMNMAKGDWIIFGDADDLLDCHMVEGMVETAIRQKADMVCCYLEYFDDRINKNAYIDNTIKKILCSTYPYIDTKHEQYHIMQLIDNTPVTKLIHKSIYTKREVFFQNLPNANDVYYSMIAGICSQKIVYVDKVFYHYRGNKNRKTLSTDRDMKINYIFQAMDNVYDYIKDKETNCLLKRSFYNAVLFNLSVYLECPVYNTLFDALRNNYFDKWSMYRHEIMEELSYINKVFYQNILDNKKDVSRQECYMQAKVEFVRALSKKGCSIWGTGSMGSPLLENLAGTDIKIQHVFDSAQDKWGKKIHGYIVENYNEVQADHIIITTSIFYEEIKGLIQKSANNIYNLEQQIWLVPDKGAEVY